jgi:hypothetical protein
MATSLEKFQIYREEDKHECNLLSTRINALLTSQSLFLAAAAVLYSMSQAREGEHRLLLALLAFIGLAATVLTGIAILIGCRVLRRWHEHGSKLLLNEGYKNDIDGCYLKDRKQPDLGHKVSIEIFGISLPLIFAVFWLFVIAGLFLR